MKIAIFELERWEEKEIKKELKGHQIQFFPRQVTVTTAKKLKDVEALAVFIYSKVDAAVLDAMPKLKFIATMSTGFDHIDLAACKKRKITVSNVPYYGENTVAEHTFALILALSRKIPQSVENTRKHNFGLKGLQGFDLKGKTLGVIGTGHIGQHVIRIAKGFEMNVIAFDIKKNIRCAKELGYKYVSFDSLLLKSDIVTLHAPYNKHTHHLINKKNIQKMKKGSYLINTSRGGLIDTTALVSGLRSGQIAGAGLDVLEGERMIKEEKEILTTDNKEDLMSVIENNMLLNNPNVLITPHSAFYSEEALLRILCTTIDNLKGFIQKKKINVVS